MRGLSMKVKASTLTERRHSTGSRSQHGLIEVFIYSAVGAERILVPCEIDRGQPLLDFLFGFEGIHQDRIHVLVFSFAAGLLALLAPVARVWVLASFFRPPAVLGEDHDQRKQSVASIIHSPI